MEVNAEQIRRVLSFKSRLVQAENFWNKKGNKELALKFSSEVLAVNIVLGALGLPKDEKDLIAKETAKENWQNGDH